MTASMRPIPLTWSAMLLVWAALLRSPTTIPLARDASPAMVAARGADRACNTTLWPLSRIDCAAARPSPSVLPVMNTIATCRSLPCSLSATLLRGLLPLRRLSAVDDHSVSNYEGGGLRAQPHDGRGYFLGFPHPSDRLLCNHSFPSLWCAAAEAVHRWRFNDAGAYDVHTNFRLGVVEGCRLRQTNHAEFGRAVRRLACEALDPRTG